MPQVRSAPSNACWESWVAVLKEGGGGGGGGVVLVVLMVVVVVVVAIVVVVLQPQPQPQPHPQPLLQACPTSAIKKRLAQTRQCLQVGWRSFENAAVLRSSGSVPA